MQGNNDNITPLKINKPSIFHYTNYREYLNDYYLFRKSNKANAFSFRYFNKIAGFTGTNFLHLVIKNKRNLSVESVDKISKAIYLSDKERNYFLNLVNFNQAITQKEKEVYYNNLKVFNEYKNVHFLEGEQNHYLDQWYYPVVRELINLKEFRPDPKWIADHIRPKITPEEAKQALNVLLDIGMAKIENNGAWKQCFPEVESYENTDSNKILQYQEEIIKQGCQHLTAEDKTEETANMTMSISRNKKTLIYKRIEEFKNDIQRLITQNEAEDALATKYYCDSSLESENQKIDRVCQLNIQFFQVTEQTQGNSDNTGGKDA